MRYTFTGEIWTIWKGLTRRKQIERANVKGNMEMCIREGFLEKPSSLRRLRIDTATYEGCKVYVYSFKFPYYLHDADLRRIGRDLKWLERAVTYGPVEELVFKGFIMPIEQLLVWAYRVRMDTTHMFRKENPACKALLLRIPLEIFENVPFAIGEAATYMRIGALLDVEKK